MAFDNSKEPANCLQSKYLVGLTNTVVQAGVAGRANLYGVLLQNNAAAATYVQFFNAAATTDVTLGTTTADWTVLVPASTSLYIAPERAKKFFSLGLCYAATTSRTNSTAPATTMTADVWFSQS